MAVTKINGFDVPYRSATFQNQASKLAQTSGLMRMDGAIETTGGNVVIPPFEFIQNGLIVAESASRVRPEPTQSAPYYLTVSAATIRQVDDLSFQFPKAPEDISSNQVIIGYWDGIEWRKPQMVSIKAIYDDINQANIDFNRLGPVWGLKTSVVAMNYETEPGVLVDRRGLRQRLDGTFITPIVANDTDYNRVDRIIYRRPRDSINRVGYRKFVLGCAHDTAINKTHETEFVPSTHVNTNEKILIGSDNSVVFITARGYGNTYSLVFTKYNSDRTLELVAPVELISDAYYGEFDAVIDSSNNTHIFYSKVSAGKTVIQWVKVSTAGAVLSTSIVHSHIVSPAMRPSCSYNRDLDAIYVVDQVYLGIGNNKIFFFSLQPNGSIMQAPMQLSMLTGDLQRPSIFMSDDLTVYVACEEAFTTRIHYGVFSDIGGVVLAASVISSNTEQIGVGTLVDGAQKPRVLCSNNREPFVTFLQDKGGGQYGMTVYTQGAAYMQQLTGAGENFSAYDVIQDDFLNGLHFILKTATDIQYVKLEDRAVQFAFSLATGVMAGVATTRDKYGAMLHAWAEPLAGTFTSYDSSINVFAIGTQIVTGLLGNIGLDSTQFVVDSSAVSPRVGDQIVISGSLSGNDGTYAITNVETLDLNTPADTLRVSCSAASFNTETSPPSVVLGDFQAPDGNAVRFAKTPGELTSKAYRYDVLPTDILLARLSMPGPTVLNWTSGGPGPTPTDTSKLIPWGDPVTFDWSAAAPGAMSISSGLHITDLVNNFTYDITAGAYAMVEGDALYVTLDLVTTPVTPTVTPVALLPWSTPIQVLGVIYQGNFVPHALLASLDIEELSPGEVQTTGHDLPDMIRARLGVISDTAYQAYDNAYNILLADNYPTAISKLDARIYDILTDFNDEETYEVPAGGITVYNSSTLVWDALNTSLDILVFVNGKKQTQDKTGTTLKDYKKLDANSLQFTYTVPEGAEIAVFKVRKGGGHPGFLITKDEGVTVLPITQYMNFIGSGVTVTDAGGGQVNVNITGGGGGGGSVSTKTYRNTSGSLLPAGTALAFDALGGIVPADANILTLSDFAGIAKADIIAGNYGECYKVGNCPGILATLGAIPGQLVYVGEIPGSLTLIPPGGLTDNIIALGRAEPEDATDPDGTATSLFLSPQIISLGS